MRNNDDNPMHPNKNRTLCAMQALTLANSSPRCGAKTRRATACRSPAMENGRCRMHGGKSPGAPRGRQHGNYKHGERSIAAIEFRKHYARLLKDSRFLIKEVTGR